MATEYVTQSNLDALKTEMRGEFALVRGEMAAMEGRLRQELGTVQKEIGGVRQELGEQSRKLVFANFAAMIGFGGFVLAAARLG